MFEFSPKKNIQITKKCARKGFSLVEVLLALGVLGIAILSIVGLLNAAFDSVSKNLSVSQALGVYSRIDRALGDASDFLTPDGKPFIKRTEMKKPSFDYIYDWVRDKKDSAWNDALFLTVFSQRINTEDNASPQLVMRVIKSENATDLPTKAQLDALNYEGNVYFVRVSISPQLEGRHVSMNESGEVLLEPYKTGSPLPGTPETYALPYIPLTLEVYPFSVGATKQSEDQHPTLTQTLIFMR